METEAQLKRSTATMIQNLIEENERLRRGILDEIPNQLMIAKANVEEANEEAHRLRKANRALRLELAFMIERFQPERSERIRGRKPTRIDATQPDDPPRGVWIGE